MHRKDVAVLALFYVDDGLVAARTTRGVDALVDLVELIFEIRKFGEPVDFLGTEIQCKRRAGIITLTQKVTAEALATAHGVQGACMVVPMSPEWCSSLRGPMAAQLP
jgi:hypothetical protein